MLGASSYGSPWLRRTCYLPSRSRQTQPLVWHLILVVCALLSALLMVLILPGYVASVRRSKRGPTWYLTYGGMAHE
jgi:hypothetical protein